MAQTYNDFWTAAGKAGLQNRFTKGDLERAVQTPEYGISLLGMFQDQAKADTEEKRLLATEAANALRKSYGVYDTGSTYAASDGSKIDELTGKMDDYGSFQYGNEDVYQDLLDKATNPEPFSYDMENDPVYQSYAKGYRREGERASANALAQASAATGGRPSTAAVQAAQQAGNYYGSQLTDKIPELYQDAYSRHQAGYEQLLQALAASKADRETAYGEWMDGYSMLQNNLQNHQTQDETDYQRYLDKVNMDLTREQMAADAKQQAFENEITKQKVQAAKEEQEKESSSFYYGEAELLEELYPDGVITDKELWTELVELYGEDVLAEAGYSYGDKTLGIGAVLGAQAGVGTYQPSDEDKKKKNKATGGGGGKFVQALKE